MSLAAQQAGRQADCQESGSLACSHLRADLQATGASALFFFSFTPPGCLVGMELPREYICRVVRSAANKLSGCLCHAREKSQL